MPEVGDIKKRYPANDPENGPAVDHIWTGEQWENVVDKFEDMCRAHDLTYEYSDDHRYWTKGNASLKRIEEFQRYLPRALAVKIWNSVVDEKVVPDVRQQFYWTEEEKTEQV